ncbi:MAG: TOBE domain-containing protein [Planctomycetes bacterium]|nr:TOBE domain-containing protein [Planctomycetota bacterium]
MLSVPRPAAGDAARPACAVGLPRGVIALVGAAGAGKSTWLAALERRPPHGTRVATIAEHPRLRRRRDVLANLALGVRAGRDRGATAAEVPTVAEALGLLDILGAAAGALDDSAARRVELGRALLARPDLLLVDVARGTPERERLALHGLLRWAAGRELPQVIVYVARSSADLEDLADGLLLLADGVLHGPDDAWDLLGRTLRGALAAELPIESLLPAAVDYLDEEGRWLRVTLADATELHLPFVRLSPGWRGRVAVPAAAVLVLREPLPGPRLTNQLRGRITAIGDLLGRQLVTVDVGAGAPLRALVEPDTVRGQGLGLGVAVVCAFEPAAVRWVRVSVEQTR